MLESKASGDAKEEEIRNDREQVRRMATYMEATWPNDSPTDTARHTLGTLYFGEGDFVKALETYARVTPSYTSLAFLRNEQGIACFNLQKDPKVPQPIKRRWFDAVTSELEKMPDLAQGAEPETAHAYCLAKMQLCNLLLQEGKQFARVEQIATTILDQCNKYDLGEKAAEVKYTAKAQMLYGLYGRTSELMKARRHPEAAALCQPFVADLEKNGIPEDEAAGKTAQGDRGFAATVFAKQRAGRPDRSGSKHAQAAREGERRTKGSNPGRRAACIRIARGSGANQRHAQERPVPTQGYDR